MDKIERIWLVRVGGGGEGDGFRCPMCGLLLNRRRWGGGIKGGWGRGVEEYVFGINCVKNG